MTTHKSDTARPPSWMQRWGLQDPRVVREFLCYCAPALLLGLVLRALMTWQMPYGYMQFDSADFLLTANRFLSRGTFDVHAKRTFLVPLLYLLPFLIKIPALVVIPIAQHILGLAVVVMTGLLVRLWVQPWRWLIVPVTLLVAANPNLLWFEHTLMSEIVYLFCITALALAATVFSRWPSNRSFAWFLGALFLAAAARPEGRLLLGFGFLLTVFVAWGEWKTLGWRLAGLVALSLATLPMTKTGQAGQLLYATVLPLAPDVSKVEPGFSAQVLPIRDRLIALGRVNTELQSLEQKLTDMAGAYLTAKGDPHPDTNAFCRRLAVEACLNRPWALPALAERKFLLSTKANVSVGFEEPRLQSKLNVGFNRKEMLDVLGKGLVGQELKAKDVSAFVSQHYHALTWYPFLENSWRRMTLGFDLGQEWNNESQIPPWPAFFVVALVGMGIAFATPGPDQRLHVAWILSMIGLWFAVELTGVVNARYRFVFEPFCLIYVALGAAFVGSKIVAGWHLLMRALHPSHAESPEPLGHTTAPRSLSKTLP